MSAEPVEIRDLFGALRAEAAARSARAELRCRLADVLGDGGADVVAALDGWLTEEYVNAAAVSRLSATLDLHTKEHA